jgi:hypothetical protein
MKNIGRFKMKKWLAFLLLGFPASVFATGDTGVINMSTTLLQIQSYSTQQNAVVYTTVTGGGCASAVPVLVMDSSNPLAAAMYSTLLTAKATGQSVDIATLGCTSSGNPIIISIYLES